MLNKVVFEGLITNTWRYGSDLFVRLASYRDPGHPVKRVNETRDEPDYINVRFTSGVQQGLDFPAGAILRIEGLLQSREYTENLAEFMEKARKTMDGPIGIELTGQSARQIVCGRSAVEILAQQHVIVQLPKPERTQPARKPALAATAQFKEEPPQPKARHKAKTASEEEFEPAE